MLTSLSLKTKWCSPLPGEAIRHQEIWQQTGKYLSGKLQKKHPSPFHYCAKTSNLLQLHFRKNKQDRILNQEPHSYHVFCLQPCWRLPHLVLCFYWLWWRCSQTVLAIFKTSHLTSLHEQLYLLMFDIRIPIHEIRAQLNSVSWLLMFSYVACCHKSVHVVQASYSY